MTLPVQALHDDAHFKLQLTLLAGHEGLHRPIAYPRVQKPGLALAGYIDSLRPNRVQVLGRTEWNYLQTLTQPQQTEALRGLASADISCVVLTSDLIPPEALLEQANATQLPLFGTPLASSELINRLQAFLDEQLSPQTSMHAVLVDVFGVGVLLTGPSGIGKSECGLDLVLRGHRLVADDVVLIQRQHRRLVGSGSPLTRHHMEVRGLGIINVKDLFGAASVRARKGIEILIEMVEWDPQGRYDRLGVDDVYTSLLNVEIPHFRLPIRPGRNVASIVEVAARNHLLRLQGHHSAREFQANLERRLAQNSASSEEGK